MGSMLRSCEMKTSDIKPRMLSGNVIKLFVKVNRHKGSYEIEGKMCLAHVNNLFFYLESVFNGKYKKIVTGD